MGTFKRESESIFFLLQILFLLFSLETVGFARFDHESASHIGREEQHSSEAFIDKLSYRPTLYLEEKWENSDVGYQINLGSLNVTRFLVDEELKLSTKGESAFLSYRRHKYQDMFVDKDISTLQVSWLDLVPHIALSFLGESDSYKRHSDIGFGLHSADLSDQVYWEIRYWMPDVTYNNKKSYGEDSLSKDSNHVEFLLRNNHRSIPVALEVEVQSPTVLKQNSENYHYHFESKRLSLKTSWVFDSASRLNANLLMQNTTEQKSLFSLAKKEAINDTNKEMGGIEMHAEYSQKSLDHFVSELDISLQKLDGNVQWKPGVWVTVREANYDFEGYVSKFEDRSYDAIPSSSVTRKEVSLYILREPAFEYGNGSWAFHQGLFLNHLIRTTTSERHENEGKLNTAFTWLPTKQASINFNITWDLDEIAHNLKKLSGPLQPWGGGNVHFQWVF